MKRLGLALFLLAAWPAHAQSPVSVIGPVTPGNCVRFNTTTVIQDAGTQCTGGSGGNVTGPVSSTLHGLPYWANTIGTQLGDANGQTIAGNYIWSGDQLFQSGRPWCDVRAKGAVGDGTTDDTMAFAACVTVVQAFAFSGTVYIPPSANKYCIKTGPLVVNGNTILLGSSGGSALSSCGSGLGVVQLGGSSGSEGNSTLQNVALYGPGMDGATGYGVTADTLVVGQNCTDCLISNVQVYGGRHSMTWNSGEATAIHVSGYNAYGSSILYFVGSSGHPAGGWLYDIKPDQPQYPQGTIPGAGTVYAARATTHAYTAGTVVLATCQDSASYYLQAMVGGTSSGSATLSNCANYQTNFTDGTVTWQLNFPNQFFHWQFDSNTSEVKVYRCDSGGGWSGIGMTNTVGGGGAPSLIYMHDCQGGFGYNSNFYGHDGNSVMLVNFNTTACITSGCNNIVFQNNFTGDVAIMGGYNNAGSTGLSINSGNRYNVSDVVDWVGDTTAVAIVNSVDYVTIHDNPVGGVPITNSSSGTHNNIHDNQGFNNTGFGAVITVGASPYTYTAGSQPQTIYITGGTVSQVANGSTGVAASMCLSTGCTVSLGPNESLVVTYSSTPTMRSVTH